MATQHLDLEEQEQLDQLKHFWKQWGNLISWLLIAVMGAYAAWNGYQYWQQRQATQAAALYDQVDVAAKAGDQAMLDRALADLRGSYGGTTYAQQANLLGATAYVNTQHPDKARTALQWVVDNGKDDGLQALARLRLSGLLADDKKLDDAAKLLQASFPATFEGLAADRLGDVFSLQGKKDEALKAYTKAYPLLPQQGDYRRLVAMKLNALGVDVKAMKPASAA